MSEPILKALMQLFAIIGHPVSNAGERRAIVEYFLKRQINQEATKQYLQIFDKFYREHQKKIKEKKKREKRTSSSSVRVLKICTEINEELTQKQKNVVLLRLFEFIKSGKQVTEQEIAFLTTVADTFNISQEEFELIKNFVLKPFDELIPSEQILIIDSNSTISLPKVKHMRSPNLDGQLRVIEIRSTSMYFIRYIGSSELYLNGQLLERDKVYVLNIGASIRSSKVSPIYYGDIISLFNIDRITTRITFEARGVDYIFKSGDIGLRDINFNEYSGKLIGIMGASGTGKSTLLNVLNGSYFPAYGEVLINDIDIHKENEKIEGLIGYVSQDDLLIEELTVYDNLYFNAKLCFANYSKEELEQAVNNTLEDLGLFDIKDMVVGTPLNKKISGGERKRLNIALELIREPAVLFLDEPTSGLSSRDSENILDLLKELTLKGKLIFAVVHQPSSEIFKMFDKLMLLDMGGYLIYSGEPIESLIYFKSSIQHANWNESECPVCGNVNPEQIFNIIEAKVLDEYGNFTNNRKISPQEWKEKFDNSELKKKQKKPKSKVQIPEIHFKIPNKLRQFFIFTKRDVLSKLSNTQYLVVNFIEAPLLAFILSYIVKFYNINSEYGYTFTENGNVPVYIFMAVIVALFIGLTVSAEEIIKDRKILKREAFLNLSWNSYLFSKIAVLFILSAIQALMFVVIGNSIIEIKGMYFEYWLMLFSTWCFATLLGLVISDSFKTAVTIYILIPFLIIPQLLLSGIIVKYEKLNPDISNPKDIPFYGEIITARWAYEALAVYQFTHNAYEKQFYPYDKAMSVGDYKNNYWLPALKNRLNYCRRNLDNPEKEEQIIQNLKLIQNEIKKESNNRSADLVKFDNPDTITYENAGPQLFLDLEDYFELVRRYYIKYYNKASNLKDTKLHELQKDSLSRQQFLKLKRNHHNEKLAEFVKNSNEINRILEYNNELIQKIDPIFLVPDNPFIKSHFYAPKKQIFGNYYHTYWVNLLVVWIMSIFLYIVLYFRLLRKAFNYFEEKQILKHKTATNKNRR
ncbi:MAG: ATP-binding cassette domain-containing protein [Bacteroidales bacterium]